MEIGISHIQTDSKQKREGISDSEDEDKILLENEQENLDDSLESRSKPINLGQHAIELEEND